MLTLGSAISKMAVMTKGRVVRRQKRDVGDPTVALTVTTEMPIMQPLEDTRFREPSPQLPDLFCRG